MRMFDMMEIKVEALWPKSIDALRHLGALAACGRSGSSGLTGAAGCSPWHGAAGEQSGWHDHARSAVERAVDEFEAEQALALERAGQHQLRGLLRRKAEAGVIGRVAEQQHGAVAAGRRLSERMRRQRRAKAQASGRRDPPPAARASAPGRPRR